jgi:hypothetical protein
MLIVKGKGLIIAAVLAILFVSGCVLQSSWPAMHKMPNSAAGQNPGCANASAKTWAKVFGGPGFNEELSLQQTSDGGYAVVGYLNTGPSVYPSGEKPYDALLFKVDADGNMLWNRTYGGNESDFAFSLQQTSDSGYIVGGETRSFGGSEAYLIKTDENGSMQWNRTFDLCEGKEGNRILSVRQTSDGGYITAGFTFSCSQKLWGERGGWDDSFIMKTDASGNEVWETAFGSKDDVDRATSVQQVADGGYVTIGYVHYYDPHGPVYIYGQDIYLAKFDKDGNMLWNKTFGVGNKTAPGNGLNEAEVFQQTSDGGYVVVGQGADSRVYLLKTDSNGTKLWEKPLGNLNSWGYSVKQTADGGYFIIGDTIIADANGNRVDYEERTIIVGDKVILDTGKAIYFLKIDANGSIVSEAFGMYRGGGRVWPIQQTPDNGYISAETIFPRTSATTYTSTTEILLMKMNEKGFVCNLSFGQPCTLLPEPRWINDPTCWNITYDEAYRNNPYLPG